MYWVVTTVVSETKADLRAKIIKQYIKIASELCAYRTLCLHRTLTVCILLLIMHWCFDCVFVLAFVFFQNGVGN